MISLMKTRWTHRTIVLVLLAACRSEPTTPTELAPSPTSTAAGLAQHAVAAAGYSFQGIGDLASKSSPRLSADGQTVVGTINGRAVKWTAATGSVPLGALPGGDGTSVPFGISADGSVIVGSASSANGTEAFRWTASGGMMALGDLPGTGSFASHALGVSADGAIVVGQSSRLWPTARAFRWTASTGLAALGSFPGGDGFSAAHAITPDGQAIVGASHNAAGQEEAFRWTASTGLVPLGFFPGSGFTRALGVSADGAVVVGAGATNRGFEGFRWTVQDGMVGLGSLDPNDFASSASAVSADGKVLVGIGSGAADFNGEAFVWFPLARMLNLKQYLLNHGASAVQGWRLIEASSVSADGLTIVGSALDPQGKPMAWIATIQIEDTPAPPPGPDTTETLRPTAASVLSGTPVSGGVAQLQGSDDAYSRLQASGKNAMQVSITGKASKAQASELRFSVEAAATGSTTRQDIALFDFAAGAWVTLRQGIATTTDATVVTATTNQPGRFIEAGTLRVLARVTFVPSGGKRVVTSARIDQASWARVP